MSQQQEVSGVPAAASASTVAAVADAMDMADGDGDAAGAQQKHPALDYIIDYSRITLGEAVGHGGFAEVHKGLLDGTQVVAVKLWKFDRASMQPDQQRLFVREVECNMLADHPRVVRFLGFCWEPLAIVMEFVPGVHLFRVCNDRRIRYTWRVVLQLVFEIAEALEHIHSKGIVHRDFKSSNVIITDQWHIKLCDFGLSRVKTVAELLTGGRGTVHWMAPEVILHQDYNQRADIYSFGIVMWEMVARYQPYQGRKNLMHVAEEVARQGLRPPMPANTPSNYAQLIAACWAQDAAQRPTLAQIRQIVGAPGFIPNELIDAYIPHPQGGV